MTKLLLSFVLATVTFAAACGGGANNTADRPSNNANAAAADDPLKTTAKTPAQTTNNAPTLTPIFKGYCEAMEKKDEASIRKYYTRDTLKDFESQMKDYKIPNLVKFLEDDGVTTKLCEVRNEEIKGDTATAIIRSEGYPNGIPVIFEKENGEWKLTNKSPALEKK
jgi:hypothetical protein